MPHSDELIVVDHDRALDLVAALMKVPGPSCREAAVVAEVRRRLLAAGVPAAAITTDTAHKKIARRR